jgi:tetratricopeptide (TPR) repeat protein
MKKLILIFFITFAFSEDIASQQKQWFSKVDPKIELTSDEHTAIYYIKGDPSAKNRDALANARVDMARKYALLYDKSKNEEDLLLALKYAHSSAVIGVSSYFSQYLDFLQQRLAHLRFSQALKLTKKYKGKNIPLDKRMKAISLMQTATMLDPNKVMYWHFVVNLYKGLGDDFLALVKTRTALNQILFLTPNDEKSRFYLISVLVKMGLLDDVKEHFEYILENGTFTSKQKIISKLTMFYLDRGNIREGIEFYEKILPKNEKLQKDILISLALLQKSQYNYKKAISILDEVVSKYGSTNYIESMKKLWSGR